MTMRQLWMAIVALAGLALCAQDASAFGRRGVRCCNPCPAVSCSPCYVQCGCPVNCCGVLPACQQSPGGVDSIGPPLKNLPSLPQTYFPNEPPY